MSTSLGIRNRIRNMLALVCVGITAGLAVALCGATCLPAAPNFGSASTCEALARESAEVAMQAFGGQPDFCRAVQIQIEALDEGCYGTLPEFVLPAGITTESLRDSLQMQESQICGAN